MFRSGSLWLIGIAATLFATPAMARGTSPHQPQAIYLDRQDLRSSHDGRDVYVLNRDFHYCSQAYRVVVTVPKTFVTDFISIPKLAGWIRRPGSPGYQAAIIHDWLYASGTGDEIARAQADYIFYEALGDYRVDPLIQRAMYEMVGKFGKKGYGLKGDWAFADTLSHKTANEAFVRTRAPAMTPVASCDGFQARLSANFDYLSSVRAAVP